MEPEILLEVLEFTVLILKYANYENDATVWDLRLFDLQTYTNITLNQSVSSSEG